MTISQKLRPRPNDKIRMTIMAHRHRLGIMFTRCERRIVRPPAAVVGKRQMKSDVIRLFTVQRVTILYGFCGVVVVIKLNTNITVKYLD